MKCWDASLIEFHVQIVDGWNVPEMEFCIDDEEVTIHVMKFCVMFVIHLNIINSYINTLHNIATWRNKYFIDLAVLQSAQTLSQ